MAEITLTVPGRSEYAIVLRTALGGVALVKDLGVDALDDLRMAADEACDCLLHQKRAARMLCLEVDDLGVALRIRLSAELEACDGVACENTVDISKAVLETLVPQVELVTQPCGCVSRIDMTMPKAAR